MGASEQTDFAWRRRTLSLDKVLKAGKKLKKLSKEVFHKTK